MHYTLTPIKGKGRGGSELGIPTINVPIPKDFPYRHGVYAGTVVISNTAHLAAIHFGPAPAFNDTRETLEIHVIDADIKRSPKELHLCIEQFIRDIEDFTSLTLLKEQIKKDIRTIKKSVLV